MSPIKRKAAVLLGTAAIFGAAGCGATSSGSSDSTAASGTQASAQQAGAAQPGPTGRSGSTAQPDQAPGGGPGGGPSLTALAGALGVSTADLQEAMQASRPAPGSTERPSPDTMAASLAKALDLDADAVAEALKEHLPQGGPPPNGTGPQGTNPQDSQAPSQAQEDTTGSTT